MFKRKWRVSSKKSDLDDNSSPPSSSEQKGARISDHDVTDKSIAASESGGQIFHHFELLSEDIQFVIFSFVANTPFDRGNINYYSTMTHVIPLVSKRFRMLSNRSNALWKEALIRNLKSEGFLWEPGIIRFLKECTIDLENETKLATIKQTVKSQNEERKNSISPGQNNNNKQESSDTAYDSITLPKYGDPNYEKDLIDQACQVVSKLMLIKPSAFTINQQSSHLNKTPAYIVYRSVVDKYIHFTAPVFHMPNCIRLGHEFRLHFFEPRYRLLIAEVMQNWPESAKNGGAITADKNGKFPSFLYANYNRLTPKSRAMIVHVRQAHIHPSGRADVLLVPVSHVQMEKVWERPNTGRLHMATAIRLEKAESEKIEESIAQELRLPRRGLNFEGQELVVGREGVGESVASVLAFLLASNNNRHFEISEVEDNQPS